MFDEYDDELMIVILCNYPNVTMLRSGLCCCRSVCLSSVALVHPTQANFR